MWPHCLCTVQFETSLFQTLSSSDLHSIVSVLVKYGRILTARQSLYAYCYDLCGPFYGRTTRLPVQCIGIRTDEDSPGGPFLGLWTVN
ncbi:hypothetical protein JR316_0002924 [Psilocybe cubensis]|uniref:Uncharacterized protein n=2 Tax=Psilocybe cubensis TaxID=181762 RepID=A0A8H7Y478_PSICU|nr:hypothetical protein JR316_0002924 [Psilocybe cubensis]KAH9483456.1 hypothetical protein JR316_0002924 [Psilocybe cubensis]